ncbi:heterodisulfide reductase-related iron-sulfur binding cluster [Chloroflexota bacterium]
MFWTDQVEYIDDIFKPIIILFLLLVPPLVFLFAFGFYRRYRIWHLGKEDSRTDRIATRVKTTVGVALAHLRIIRDFYPGWMHLIIFWGAAIFIVGKIIRLFSYAVGVDNPPQDVFLYSSFASEVGAGLLFVGGLLAIYRRYIRKPSRLDTKPDDTLIFPFVFVILLTGFMVKGYRIAISDVSPTDWTSWAPISYGFSKVFPTFLTEYKNEILIWHRTVIHALPAFVFFAYVFVSRTRMQHIWLSPLNIFFRSLGPKGAIIPQDLENSETFGVPKIEEFTWKQLLDLDACTRCGRCQDQCPANLSGKALSPKKVIQDLKEHLYEVYPYPLVNTPKEPRADMLTEVITEEVIWDCTTCRACQEACPVYIEHIQKMVDMRRHLVLEVCEFPESAQQALVSLQSRGHPWRGTTAQRTDWTSDLGIKVLSESGDDIDVLYWVGCTAALEDRNMKVAIATAKIMQSAGINFGILGVEETCCGDPARRIGDEYQFQMLCQKNIEVFQSHNIKKIVTSCPHCFNTLKHEYPQFGGNFEVVHHSELIADLISQRKLNLGNVDSMKVAYHDSCYLGRHNDIYDEPRKILKSIKGINSVELSRHGSKGFCCGGGGGHMWMEEPPEKRLNVKRVEQVIEADVNVIATACPYCLSMMEDGLKAKEKEESIKAMDLSELVTKAMLNEDSI